MLAGIIFIPIPVLPRGMPSCCLINRFVINTQDVNLSNKCTDFLIETELKILLYIIKSLIAYWNVMVLNSLLDHYPES